MNARLIVAGVALACPLAAAQPAAAPIERGDEVSASRIQQISIRYAKCVVSRSVSAARAFTLGGTKPPVEPDCLVAANDGDGAQMKFPGNTYRYALAEELLHNDYSTASVDVKEAPVREYEAIEPLNEGKLSKNVKKADAARADYKRRRTFRALSLIGDCIPRQNPKAAWTLMRSAIASPQELAAFASIKPAIARCIPENQTVTINRQVLRGMVAVGLYWMAYAVSPPAGAPPLRTDAAHA